MICHNFPASLRCPLFCSEEMGAYDLLLILFISERKIVRRETLEVFPGLLTNMLPRLLRRSYCDLYCNVLLVIYTNWYGTHFDLRKHVTKINRRNERKTVVFNWLSINIIICIYIYNTFFLNVVRRKPWLKY